MNLVGLLVNIFLSLSFNNAFKSLVLEALIIRKLEVKT